MSELVLLRFQAWHSDFCFPKPYLTYNLERSEQILRISNRVTSNELKEQIEGQWSYQ